ncbi:MAG: NAD(P)-binding domain-containing protein, partial [Gemmatimonas sp.]
MHRSAGPRIPDRMLISLAVDYQTADVATRERFHIAPARVAPLYARMSAQGITDMAIVATCNRTELYAWCPEAVEGQTDDQVALMARCWMPEGADSARLLMHAVPRTGLDAARHALRVAAGLESQILGDGQILGQFRSAYSDAATAAATGPVVHRLFETALRAGKRVLTTTLLGSGKNSVGAQAATLASEIRGSLTYARIAIVGCGKTGERVARQLQKMGAQNLVFINRAPERAMELAAELNGRGAPMHAMHTEIAMADIAFV